MADKEQSIAKRAIFLASGFGSRMVPVTLTTPKPLVKVHGKRIIDTLIDACLAAGIDEIYIVRGYLAEKFDELLEKYPMIKFIENPLYDQSNNIGSAYLARDLLENAYVFEADLVLSNPSLIKKEHNCSDVLGIWKKKSDDWCLEVDEDGFVKEEKISGENCYQMVGIYYFNQEDGRKLKNHIERVFNTSDGKNRYWETVPNQIYQGQYKIKVIPCSDKDIVEIDTFDELKSIDSSYR